MENLGQVNQQCTIGDVIASVYAEVRELPLGDQAKSAMVMFIVGEILQQKGSIFFLKKQYLQAGMNNLIK